MAKLLGKWIDDRQIDYNHILISNDQYVLGRNNADSADVSMMKVNAADKLEFGAAPVWGTAPAAGDELANKDYVDAVIFGMRDPKDACRLATTGNINLASAPATIDGQAGVSGDRIGVIAQTSADENGIYIYNGAAAAMTRSTDADEDAEVTQGMSFMVTDGTANALKTFALTTADPIVVDTTNLTFVQVPSIGNLVLWQNPVVTLLAGDITNGYIDLAHDADQNSLHVTPVGGAQQELGSDFTLSVPTTVTRITFAGDLVANAAASDKLLINYVYNP